MSNIVCVFDRKEKWNLLILILYQRLQMLSMNLVFDLYIRFCKIMIENSEPNLASQNYRLLKEWMTTI